MIINFLMLMEISKVERFLVIAERRNTGEIFRLPDAYKGNSYELVLKKIGNVFHSLLFNFSFRVFFHCKLLFATQISIDSKYCSVLPGRKLFFLANLHAAEYSL